MMNLQGPNYAIDNVMPNSLRNSPGGSAPVSNDRIRILGIISTAASFTLQDGGGLVIASMSAAGSITFAKPMSVFDFKMTAFTGPGQVTIIAEA